MSVAEVVGPGEEASGLREDARRLYEAEGQRRGGYPSVGCAVSTVIGLTPTPTR